MMAKSGKMALVHGQIPRPCILWLAVWHGWHSRLLQFVLNLRYRINTTQRMV
jgi:hypothetical protein